MCFIVRNMLTVSVTVGLVIHHSVIRALTASDNILKKKKTYQATDSMPIKTSLDVSVFYCFYKLNHGQYNLTLTRI